MKKIYLVQKMEREAFKKYARKGVKANNLDCYGEVQTLWCESKQNAIISCRKYNQGHHFYIYFVHKINDFKK